ncbi:tyrosine-type recombinase/integrase [Thalassotalea sp. 1_MG-2023]|uniref:tyrosine-type recombinase/integrase n=1 Tax=Thalassotalea sp. 1_MG-2023 TaxID=3062680 RepID=UPI0026E3D611|nr:tyrosine-type recombinase/integrase [Thalassotalea sp. 1_MG-2023]MDO6426836.1 tyrosine-type recombinase/integrase [Thalassotalea sp. 1_MG-2023]
MFANKSASEIYLMSLQSEQSRVTMASLLNVVAFKLQKKKCHQHVDWSFLHYEHILYFLSDLSSQGKSPATINVYLSALKGVAKEAWRKKEIDVETYQHIKEIKRVRGSRSVKGRALSLDELNQLIDYCMMQDGVIAMRDAAVVALVYGAGLRRHEAANLLLSDLNLKEATLRVLGKGNKERVNALHNRILEILDVWLLERGNEPGPLFLRARKGNKLINAPISGQTIYDIIIRRYQEAGLKRLTPHDLRRTYATKLLENGEDVFVVQDLMGHSSVETTKNYDKRADIAKNKAAKALPF